jgi:hypothetical protein
MGAQTPFANRGQLSGVEVANGMPPDNLKLFQEEARGRSSPAEKWANATEIRQNRAETGRVRLLK